MNVIDQMEAKTPKTCTHSGCKAKAVWRVGWKAWAFGHAKIDRNKLEAWFDNYVVCDEHRAGIDVKDLLVPAGRERVNSALMAMGRSLLDFTTAELSFRKVEDGLR